MLRACETMGNATVICSDKTGTLTQNKMTVVSGTWGFASSFDQAPTDGDRPSVTVSEMAKQLSATVRNLIIKSIALNSTAFEEDKDGQKEFVGSKTEVALLQLAKDYFGMDVAMERASEETVQLIPFDSSRKCMGIVYREPNAGYRLLVKGAAELMAKSCTATIADVSVDRITIEEFAEKGNQKIFDVINSYAVRSLRTIGLVYRDFESWPPKDAQTMEDDQSAAEFEGVFHDMTWIGVVGIQDPLRPEVPAAIRKCHDAGVQVKMVTGSSPLILLKTNLDSATESRVSQVIT